MKVMAHCGYSGMYPENTMPAIRKAAGISTNYPGIAKAWIASRS